MKEWLEVDRSIFLAELLRLEGRGPLSGHLCSCGNSRPAEYRCTDCFGGRMACQSCILTWHAGLPLHRTEVRLIFCIRFSSYAKF